MLSRYKHFHSSQCLMVVVGRCSKILAYWGCMHCGLSQAMSKQHSVTASFNLDAKVNSDTGFWSFLYWGVHEEGDQPCPRPGVSKGHFLWWGHPLSRCLGHQVGLQPQGRALLPSVQREVSAQQPWPPQCCLHIRQPVSAAPWTHWRHLQYNTSKEC